MPKRQLRFRNATPKVAKPGSGWALPAGLKGNTVGTRFVLIRDCPRNCEREPHPTKPLGPILDLGRRRVGVEA